VNPCFVYAALGGARDPAPGGWLCGGPGWGAARRMPWGCSGALGLLRGVTAHLPAER